MEILTEDDTNVERGSSDINVDIQARDAEDDFLSVVDSGRAQPAPGSAFDALLGKPHIKRCIRESFHQQPKAGAVGEKCEPINKISRLVLSQSRGRPEHKSTSEQECSQGPSPLGSEFSVLERVGLHDPTQRVPEDVEWFRLLNRHSISSRDRSMCFTLMRWNVPTIDRVNNAHALSMELVWMSPTTHSSVAWLTVSCRGSSSSIPM